MSIAIVQIAIDTYMDNWGETGNFSGKLETRSQRNTAN